MLKKLFPYTITTLIMFALAAGVHFGIRDMSERIVRIEAESEASKWARYFLDEMPAIDSLLQTGKPNDQQLDVIQTAEKVGNVFRFKLFNLQGDMVLVSDEPVKADGPNDFEHNEKAIGVVSSGKSNIRLKDGTERKNRPPVYVEAYVPVIDEQGEIVSVVEVYLDQTEKSELISSNFTRLAVILVGTVVLAFGLPAVGFIVKTYQEKRAQRKIEYLANYDPTTDLLNRASFSEHLINRCDVLDAKWRNAAIVYLDVDSFKEINDTFGHDAGDQFLRHVAASLAQVQNNGDLVARLGGDEFVLVSFGQSRNNAEDLVMALRESICRPINVDGRTIVGTASVGIYWEEESRIPAPTRIRRADLALYQAKIDGRNTHRFFSEELEKRVETHRKIEKAVCSGIEDNRFDLNFQPLVDAESGHCTGFEALLRLTDEQGKAINPSDFVPIAETIGKIKEIGLWALERAIETAVQWPDDLSISVNLSVRQFEDGDLASNVSKMLDKHGLLPSRLELEVTETVLIENAETIGPQIRQLREIGVSLAMDDFGAGYSSLGYLWQFPFDKLKIDRSFISALDEESETARDILDAVITLGHKLNMKVTAEGIESISQARILSDISCDYMQGFYYGKPMKSDEIAAYLLRTFYAPIKEANASVEMKQVV